MLLHRNCSQQVRGCVLWVQRSFRITKWPSPVRKWTTTMIGLAAIPFIVRPIDAGVEIAMDHTLRKCYTIDHHSKKWTATIVIVCFLEFCISLLLVILLKFIIETSIFIFLVILSNCNGYSLMCKFLFNKIERYQDFNNS